MLTRAEFRRLTADLRELALRERIARAVCAANPHDAWARCALHIVQGQRAITEQAHASRRLFA